MAYVHPSGTSYIGLQNCCAMRILYELSSPRLTAAQLTRENLRQGYGQTGGLLATTNSRDQAHAEKCLAEAGWYKMGIVRSNYTGYPVNLWLMDLSGQYKQPKPAKKGTVTTVASAPVVQVQAPPKAVRKPVEFMYYAQCLVCKTHAYCSSRVRPRCKRCHPSTRAV